MKVLISNWLLNSKISQLETLKLLEVLVFASAFFYRDDREYRANGVDMVDRVDWVESRVVDPYHFDMDPDPRIRIGEKWIRFLFLIQF